MGCSFTLEVPEVTCGEAHAEPWLQIKAVAPELLASTFPAARVRGGGEVMLQS